MLRTRLSLAVALVALASPALVSPALADAGRADRAAARHTGPAPGDPPWVTVASGLDNPRLLSFSDHALYVAEAGRGGSGPCVEGPEGLACLGATGAITRISHKGSYRVVTGLPSLAGAGGGGAIGPHDVIVLGHHRYAATIGLGNDPAERAKTLGDAGRALGTVVAGNLHGGPARVVADLAAYEAANDPDGNGPDTNPTGMALDHWSAVVTDSGGNTLLRVRPGGHVEELAVFPNTPVPAPGPPPQPTVPMQAVPTSVVRGDDGAYYVSQLTGFPFPAGGASIWRVVEGEAPTVYASGLTNVTDLAWYHGSLYAVQISSTGLLTVPEGTPPTGSLVKVTPGAAPTPVAEGLPAPYGVALRYGKAFVTTCAVCAGGGSVVAVDLW
jgi:hypothetical protein